MSQEVKPMLRWNEPGLGLRPEKYFGSFCRVTYEMNLVIAENDIICSDFGHFKSRISSLASVSALAQCETGFQKYISIIE